MPHNISLTYIFIHSSLYLLIPPHYLLPTSNLLFVFYICVCFFVLLLYLLIYLLDFKYVLLYSICLSLTYFTKHSTFKSIHVTVNGNILFFSRVAMLCYAKSLQSCPTLCDPIDGSPPGSPVPGTLQARTLEWVAISFSNA